MTDENRIFFFSCFVYFLDCSMAASTNDWQTLLKVSPKDIDVDNSAEEEKNEKLGDTYVNVRI